MLSSCSYSDRVACSIAYFHVDDFTWESHALVMCRLIRRIEQGYTGTDMRRQASELGQGRVARL